MSSMLKEMKIIRPKETVYERIKIFRFAIMMQQANMVIPLVMKSSIKPSSLMVNYWLKKQTFTKMKAYTKAVANQNMIALKLKSLSFRPRS